VLAKWLAYNFLWEPTDALWFVVTNEVPTASTVEVEHDRRHDVFTVTVRPWLSAETWGKIYRGIHDTRGKDNRPLKRSTLGVLRFVAKQKMNAQDDQGNQPTLKELWTDWKKQGSDPKFYDSSGLRRAYERAKKVLVPPMWR
jgi:hypothetical protein